MNALEILFIQNLQDSLPSIGPLMKLFTFMGTFEFMMLFIPFIYWLVDRSLGLRLIFLLVLTDTFTGYLKQLIRGPRPYWIENRLQMASEASYGIPSSHSSTAVALWGYLIYAIRKPWMWILGILIILSIGFSRMYLGVHFPHDVLAGWLLGLLVLFLFILLEKPVTTWWSKFSDPIQILLGFIASLLIIGVGVLILQITSAWPDPPAWAKFSTDSRLPNSYVNYGGVFFGAILGILSARRYANFQTAGIWWKKMLRYLVGLVGVGIFYFGLDIVFGMVAEDASAVGYLLRYIRYAFAAYWLIFVAPWIFIILKLADQNG